MGAEEGTLALLEGSSVAWKREEALAGIKGAVFVELPAPTADAEAKQRASAPTLTDRLQAELLTAKVVPAFSQLALCAPFLTCVAG